jgi:hypothetical protein
MMTRKRRDEHRVEVAAVAEEEARAIGELRQLHRELKRRIREDVAESNRRLDAAARKGNEVLHSERE